MFRALTRIAEVVGSNPGIDTFHSTGEKIFDFDFQLQRN